MRKTLCCVCLLLGICLLVACTASPTATAAVSPVGETPAEIQATDSGGDTPEEVQSMVQYDDSSIAEADFQYRVYIQPRGTDLLATVLVLCNGQTYYLNTPTDGTNVNNHCVIKTAKEDVYIVLPDGSILRFAPFSELQINLSAGLSQVILQKGEVFAHIAPQGEARRLVIDAGDQEVEVKGTDFGVSLKDKLINVVVIDGRVYTHRCVDWEKYTCMKWEQLSVTMEPTTKYSGSVGSSDWTTLSAADRWDLAQSGLQDMPLAVSEVEESAAFIWLNPFNGAYNDENNYASSTEYLSSLILNDVNMLPYDPNAYNERVYNQNNSGDDKYCQAYPADCPASPLIETPPPVEQPSMSDSDSGGGGSPSGKFPQFDRSSCFTNGGHLWCYPVAGSVDESLSGEWDLTAICQQYPGETFCSWQ
jgi:hypothetical protein